MKNAKPISRRDKEWVSVAGGDSDWAALRALTDDDVEASVQTDEEERDLVVDWQNAKLVLPERKKTMTIRLDADVLAFYRDMGRGYQTTINAVLRSYMEHAKG